MQISPEAYCDAVCILNDAPQSIKPMSIIEMHLFSYLGCVLALFEGYPLGDLGYEYAVTSDGFPFSVELEEARKNLVNRSLIELDNTGYMKPVQPLLNDELNNLTSIGSLATRRSWFRTATECALALPIGSIRYAIGQSPGMAASIPLGQRNNLFGADDVELLYDEYGIVRSALGNKAQELLSPAVLWLSARVIRQEGDGSED